MLQYDREFEQYPDARHIHNKRMGAVDLFRFESVELQEQLQEDDELVISDGAEGDIDNPT